MNYYIQGCAAKADKIRAAFEKLGYDVTGFDMCNDNILFFTYKLQTGANVISTTNAHLYTANIIKTHPDYKELELPVEPKFKVGDWIVATGKCVYLITKIDEFTVILVDVMGDKYEFGADLLNDATLWTVNDAQNGDVLAAHEVIVLFKEIDGLNIRTHFSYHYMNTPMTFTNDLHNKYAFSPATKDERELLFAKMKEAGYQWDDDKKELRKIQPHYNIANFYAGMPVLVRDYNNSQWSYVQFSHLIAERNVGEGGFKFNACGIPYIQCIPFEGNETLLGTTDMCNERFINW